MACSTAVKRKVGAILSTLVAPPPRREEETRRDEEGAKRRRLAALRTALKPPEETRTRTTTKTSQTYGNEVAEALTCPKCGEAMDAPTLWSGNHETFCWGCVPATAPATERFPNRSLRRLVDKIRLACCHAGCAAGSVPFAEWIEHTATCPAAPRCRAAKWGCAFRGTRDQVKAHEASSCAAAKLADRLAAVETALLDAAGDEVAALEREVAVARSERRLFYPCGLPSEPKVEVQAAFPTGRVTVKNVPDGTLAARAGMRAGDVVLHIGPYDVRATTHDAFQKAIQFAKTHDAWLVYRAQRRTDDDAGGTVDDDDEDDDEDSKPVSSSSPKIKGTYNLPSPTSVTVPPTAKL